MKHKWMRFRLRDDNVDAAGAGGGASDGAGSADLSGGVGNGQATGTGHVADTFDSKAAVDSISESLFGQTKEASAGNETETKATVPATPETPETSAATEAPVGPAAPKTWKPEEQAAWATVPEAAKAAILRREEDIFRGIEQYKAPAEFGNSVKTVLAPYEGIMRQHNMDPVETIGNLLNAHHTLATASPSQKTAFMHDLARQYGVDLEGAGQGFEPVVDPEVADLRARLQSVQSAQETLQRQRYEEVRGQMASQVNAFAEDPKNVHFVKVSEIMAPMLSADKNLSLAEAYERAVWQHPETRELEIARIASEKQAKAIAEGKAAAELARKAQAGNVNVRPKPGAATVALGSMDDTMQETMAAIAARGN